MWRPRIVLSLCLSVTLAAASGCSLVFMERAQGKSDPDEIQVRAPTKCSKDTDLAWWDVVLTGIDGAIGTAASLTAFTDDSASTSGRLTVGLIFMALAGTHAYSALQGFKWAKECQALED